MQLQKSDPHINELRKQWENNNLDKNTYTMENNILKCKIIDNGLLYLPIVVPDILRDCLLILAHDKQGHDGFRWTYASLKKDTNGKPLRNQYTNTAQTAKYAQNTTSRCNNSRTNTSHHHHNPWNS